MGLGEPVCTLLGMTQQRETLMIQREKRKIFGSEVLERLREHRIQCSSAGIEQSWEVKSCLLLDL